MKKLIVGTCLTALILIPSVASAMEFSSKDEACQTMAEDTKFIIDSRLDNVTIYQVLNLIKDSEYSDYMKKEFVKITNLTYDTSWQDILMVGSGEVASQFYMKCMKSGESL